LAPTNSAARSNLELIVMIAAFAPRANRFTNPAPNSVSIVLPTAMPDRSLDFQAW